MDDVVKTKICSKCPEKGPQPLTAFSKNRSAKDGLLARCKACESKRLAAYHVQNAERNTARARQWRLEHAEESQAYQKSYAKKHAEKKKAIAVKWYADNTLRAKTTHYAYAKANPERLRAIADKRRVLAAKAPFRETVSLDAIYLRDKGICQLCFKKCSREQATRDHVIPISKGGAHSFQNIVLAHNSCNSAKNNRPRMQQQRLF